MNPGKFKELYDERLNPDCNFLFPKAKQNCDKWKLNEPKTSDGGEIYYETEKITEDTVAEMLPKVRKKTLLKNKCFDVACIFHFSLAFCGCWMPPSNE